MTRIKKGLDYYCFFTDTFHDLRIKRLRRLCRNNGLMVYIYLLTEANRVEGYYVPVNSELVLDIAEYFYLTEEEVEKIIGTCCNEKLFDLGLYQQFGVLTSVELQERYASICIRLRRNEIGIAPEYLLIEEPKPAARNKVKKLEKEVEGSACKQETGNEMLLQRRDICPQKKEKEKKEEEMKPLPFIPSPESGKGEEDVMRGDESFSQEKRGAATNLLTEEEHILPNPNTPCPRGEGRNYEGMVEALQRLHIETKDINAILKMSNFGEVGDPVWKAIYTIGCATPGTFKQPAKYIYSVVHKKRQQKGGAQL